MKILLTSTSFQDTPGKHHDALLDTGYKIDKIRGPATEKTLLPIISEYDGVICGDDYFTREVIERGKRGRLKVLSKYGIGLDKIDLDAAEEFGIKVANCPGVNHVVVAEHIFALILTYYKNIPEEINITRKGKWERLIGHEIYGKKIGVAGLGRIGKEVLLRAKAFGLELYAFDKYMDMDFINMHQVKVCDTLENLFSKVHIVSLNMSLNDENSKCINKNIIENHTNKGLLLINTARGKLVDENAILFGIRNKILSGYLTDVLEEEPMDKNHAFIKYNNILITPHIGSRTYQSVERQGLMALSNLTKYLSTAI